MKTPVPPVRGGAYPMSMTGRQLAIALAAILVATVVVLDRKSVV